LPLGKYSVTFDLELEAPDAGNQLRLTVTSTPAVVVDTPQYATAGLTFYAGSVQQSSQNATTIGQVNVSAPVAEPKLQPVSETVVVTLNSTGYLNFPAFELSQSMSVYLQDIQIVELSGLA
jgi:hypothetical protein